jgi:hypothetical protein
MPKSASRYFILIATCFLSIVASDVSQAAPVAVPSATVRSTPFPPGSPSPISTPPSVWGNLFDKCSPNLKSPSSMTCDVCSSSSSSPTVMSGLGGKGACSECIAVCQRQVSAIPYPDRWYICATTCLTAANLGCPVLFSNCTNILRMAQVPGGAIAAKTASELCMATYLQVCGGR